jgi:argininosuccinate lyase
LKNDNEIPELPIKEDELRAALDPEKIIKQRLTLGGPQPEEMKKMLTEFNRIQLANESWINEQKKFIDISLQRLDEDFARYSTSK